MHGWHPALGVSSRCSLLVAYHFLMRSRRPFWRAFDFALIVVVLVLAAFVVFAVVTAMRA